MYHNKLIKKIINDFFKYKKVSRITCKGERLKECRLDKLSVKIQQGFLRHHMTKAAWTYQVITIKFTQMRNHAVWFVGSLIHNTIKKILIINSLTWMYYYYLCLWMSKGENISISTSWSTYWNPWIFFLYSRIKALEIWRKYRDQYALLQYCLGIFFGNCYMCIYLQCYPYKKNCFISNNVKIFTVI